MQDLITPQNLHANVTYDRRTKAVHAKSEDIQFTICIAFLFRARTKDFSLFQSVPASSTNPQLPIHSTPEALSPGVKRPGREADRGQ